jgi:hypothetical protein
MTGDEPTVGGHHTDAAHPPSPGMLKTDSTGANSSITSMRYPPTVRCNWRKLEGRGSPILNS